MSAKETLATLRNTVRLALQTYPGLRAADARIAGVQARVTGANLPIYNPELEAELENAGEKTYKLGVRQSIDWHDKHSARRHEQQSTLQLVKARKFQLVTTVATDVLLAMADFYSASHINSLHEQRIELLQQVIELAEQRLAAGDINKSEMLLAKLSLANATIQRANQQVSVIESKKTFYQLTGQSIDPSPAFLIPVPEKLGPDIIPDNIASEHPAEKMALLRVEQSKRQVSARQRERRADPAFGLNFGKEGDEVLMGVTFSRTWQVRNDLGYTVTEARKRQLQAELHAQNTHRRIIAAIKAAGTQYEIMAGTWKVWLSSGKNQLNEHVGLLAQLWRGGEISTSDYLLQLEQNIHTRIAGARLKGDMWRAWINWLNATGSVLDWLELDKEFGIKGTKK
ncbi:MAG: TolC family protein [Gammaproteobacteria bacterium]